LGEGQQLTIHQVLDAYSAFTGTQLEIMTHSESPWILARGGIGQFARCETEISEMEMASCYKARLK
jgi:uncharacterized phage-associated protein